METAQVDFDTTVPAAGLSAEQLEELLREIGAQRYHNLHPFHKLLHGGKTLQEAGAGLGAEPLLLSVDDPAERHRADVQDGGP